MQADGVAGRLAGETRLLDGDVAEAGFDGAQPRGQLRVRPAGFEFVAGFVHAFEFGLLAGEHRLQFDSGRAGEALQRGGEARRGGFGGVEQVVEGGGFAGEGFGLGAPGRQFGEGLAGGGVLRGDGLTGLPGRAQHMAPAQQQEHDRQRNEAQAQHAGVELDELADHVLPPGLALTGQLRVNSSSSRRV